MDMSLFILPDAVFGQTPNAQPVGGMHAEVLQPNPVEENDLPWWHTIDEMIANLPVDEGQKSKLKAYAEAISDPDNAPGYTADVGGVDADVLRIVTTGARKIARQKQINASMDKSMTAAQMMRETTSKAKGEGSRGGHIVGHNRSGAAIYSSAKATLSHLGDRDSKVVGKTGSGKDLPRSNLSHQNDAKWSNQDHADAAKIYQEHADHHGNEARKTESRNQKSNHEHDQAKFHSQASYHRQKAGHDVSKNQSMTPAQMMRETVRKAQDR